MPKWVRVLAVLIMLSAVSMGSPLVTMAGNEGDTNEEARTGSTQGTPLLRAIADWEREKYEVLKAVDPKLRRAQAFIMEGDTGSALEAAAEDGVALATMRLIVKYDPVRIRYKATETTAHAIIEQMILKEQPVRALITAMTFGMVMSFSPESSLDVATGAVFGKVTKAARAYSKVAGKVAVNAQAAVTAAVNTVSLAKAVATRVQQDMQQAHQDAAQAESQGESQGAPE